MFCHKHIETFLKIDNRLCQSNTRLHTVRTEKCMFTEQNYSLEKKFLRYINVARTNSKNKGT